MKFTKIEMMLIEQRSNLFDALAKLVEHEWRSAEDGTPMVRSFLRRGDVFLCEADTTWSSFRDRHEDELRRVIELNAADLLVAEIMNGEHKIVVEGDAE